MRQRQLQLDYKGDKFDKPDTKKKYDNYEEKITKIKEKILKEIELYK